MKNWILRFRQADKKLFNEVKDGSKSIETRAATVKYKPIEVGDTLTFVCGNERLLKTITKKYHWKSIDQMVKQIPYQNVMPSVPTVKAMKKIYASYPGYDEKIGEFGLLGFEMK